MCTGFPEFYTFAGESSIFNFFTGAGQLLHSARLYNKIFYTFSCPGNVKLQEKITKEEFRMEQIVKKYSGLKA